jgi:hypothetical protein
MRKIVTVISVLAAFTLFSAVTAEAVPKVCETSFSLQIASEQQVAEYAYREEPEDLRPPWQRF